MYKVMALDIGTKRIGIALSDYLLMLANGHSYIPREPETIAIEKIKQIAKENNVKNSYRCTFQHGWDRRGTSSRL